jgi:hypothetical protein
VKIESDIERVELDDLPTPHERCAWGEWMRHHGVDPNDVAICPGWIERRPAERQVAWLAYQLNEHGRLRWDAARNDAVREIHVVQLEAVPSPWPDVAAGVVT